MSKKMESGISGKKFKIQLRSYEEICEKLVKLYEARAENLSYGQPLPSTLREEVRTQAYMIQILEWVLGGPVVSNL